MHYSFDRGDEDSGGAFGHFDSRIHCISLASPSSCKGHQALELDNSDQQLRSRQFRVSRPHHEEYTYEYVGPTGPGETDTQI